MPPQGNCLSNKSSFTKALDKDIDRILFPWYERLWMSIDQKLFSQWPGRQSPIQKTIELEPKPKKKIKICDRYEILKNENRKRNKKGTRRL
jgi:hypothetical protein